MGRLLSFSVFQLGKILHRPQPSSGSLAILLSVVFESFPLMEQIISTTGMDLHDSHNVACVCLKKASVADKVGGRVSHLA